MQMKMIACHPRLILQKKKKKNATIGCHFLMLPQENHVIPQRRGKNIMCYFPRARVQLYNHAPEAFLKELCFQFHS